MWVQVKPSGVGCVYDELLNTFYLARDQLAERFASASGR